MENLVPNDTLKNHCMHGLSNEFRLFPTGGGYLYDDCYYATRHMVLQGLPTKMICSAPLSRVSLQESSRCHSQLGISCRAMTNIGVG